MNFDSKTQFEFDVVPKDQRRNGLSLTVVWVGYVAVVVDLLVGGGLGNSMPIDSAILSIIIGNFILMVIASIAGFLSYKRGQTFALLMEQTFGKYATSALALLIALIAIGWFSIQSSLFAHFIGVQLDLGSTSESILAIMLSIAMSITAYFGIDALRRLSAFAVPSLIVVCIYTWLTVPVKLQEQIVTTNLSIMSAIVIVIGSWIMGSTTTVGDIMRFARTAKTAIIGSMIGISANLILMVFGALAVNRYGTADLAEVLVISAGFVGGLIFFALNVWTTNDNAIYSAGLLTSVATKLIHRKSILLVVIFAVIISAFKPFRYEILTEWLQILGKVIPPIGAVVFVSTFVKFKYNVNDISTISLISYGLGISSAFIFQFGIVPLTGFFVAAISQILLIYYFRLRSLSTY